MGLVSPTARAYSLIFSRPTAYSTGSWLFPIAFVFTGMRALLQIVGRGRGAARGSLRIRPVAARRALPGRRRRPSLIKTRSAHAKSGRGAQGEGAIAPCPEPRRSERDVLAACSRPHQLVLVVVSGLTRRIEELN